MVEWLASFGKTNTNGVTRQLYSKEWTLAQEALKSRMESVGLNAYYDDVGNLFGRLTGTHTHSACILTGSHIDTVIDGGKYDGAYGVIAGLIALEYLYKHYGLPRKTIEVVSLCEEEGSRFPMTYWGSGSITGIKSYEDVCKLRDLDGISFVDAMNNAGFGQGKYLHPKRENIDCFLELHIEQGEILEREQRQIGIVSHIVGQRRYTITIIGESNHAGTTPMVWRKDALHTASELIQTLMQRTTETSLDLVSTVGQIEVEPNLSNVIPKKVTFSMDIRHSNEHVLNTFCNEIFREFEQIVGKHGTQLTIHNWMNELPVKMDEALNKIAGSILEKEKVPFKKMSSGAGHDSQVFGRICPTLLLFVPSHKGISHSPYEHTKTEDLVKGIELLIKILFELAY
ncbi:allantoate amidohydrolase [Paenibacillus jamilae]|uniref:Allantoate amidohydrolase n=2 Tax=Paenibacillus TaxID=44249 RepID=A0ACC4ZNS7_9BACL|nr:allantoate amidohydrolase [Paenibacillus sp. lzh-N1]KTS77470.1 allantoate amidohydrolase [Paenibacillus jamilae]